MEVEVWDEDFQDKFLTIQYHDVHIDGDMWLDGMNVLTEWNTIKMDHANIKSDIVKNLERKNINRRVTDYFNYAFDMIIPWANEFHPYGVSSIPIPETIVDLVRIRNLKMAVRDNYFSFTLDPEFIMKANAEERRRHLQVLSSQPEYEHILNHAQEFIHALLI